MTPPRFFFDRCCPIKLATVVKAYEDDHEVRHFDDDARFEKDTPDVVWIERLAEEKCNWVIVSMDAKMLKRPHEKQAIRESGLPFFLFGDAWMRMTMNEKCWKLIKVWPNLVRTTLEMRPRIFEVMGGSSLKIEER
jgi:hypothetical protein